MQVLKKHALLHIFLFVHEVKFPFQLEFIKFFFASSTALAIASETSLDFPKPCPTTPFSSPTTTIAENPNARPPLVTLLLRTPTKRSFKSKPAGLTVLHFIILIHI